MFYFRRGVSSSLQWSSPVLCLALCFVWSTAMPIYLSVACGHFPATVVAVVDLSSCNRDQIAHKAENIYHMAPN